MAAPTVFRPWRITRPTKLLGIGGPGSNLGPERRPPCPPGDLDLCSLGALGVRNYSTSDPTDTPYSYFSIDGGKTVVSYFNQVAGADYADWYSVTGPAPGFGPQVQDAFGIPGTNPALGPNELTAFAAIGYSLTSQAVPEPSTLTMLGTVVVVFASGFGWSSRRNRRAGVTTAL